MQGFLILTLLLVEVAVLSRLDHKRFGTWVTPFNTLAFPYAAVVLLAYFVAPMLDFVPLYMPSVLIWIVGLLLVWAAGAFLSWGMLDMRGAEVGRDVPPTASIYDSGAIRLATILTWISVPVILYGLFSMVRASGGWAQFGTEDFREEYSHGVHAHAEVLATLLSILLIGTYRRGQKWSLAVIGSLVLCIIASRSKGHIMEVIAGGLLFRIMRGTLRISLTKVTVLAFVTYIVFNFAYVLGMLAVSPENVLNSDTYVNLARHYFYYLCAGPLALGEAIKLGVMDVGGDWTAIFAPFINLHRALLHSGSLVEAGSTHGKGMLTGLVSHNEVGVNVYTFFGTPYLYLGLLGALLYVVIVGMLCYALMICVQRQNNPWLTAAYSFVAAQLVLGFFELYFWYLTTYEIVVLSVFLMLWTRERTKPRRSFIVAEPSSACG